MMTPVTCRVQVLRATYSAACSGGAAGTSPLIGDEKALHASRNGHVTFVHLLQRRRLLDVHPGHLDAQAMTRRATMLNKPQKW